MFGYVAHGAETEATLRATRAAFDAWRLVTRVLVGVSKRHQDVELFGRRYAAPFGIAPMGGSALVAYEGHTVMARAAAEARIPFILSANSIIPLEEVVRQSEYVVRRLSMARSGAIEGMVERLRAGVAVLVVTADVPIGSNREADARAGFGFPIRPGLKLGWDVATHPRWLASVLARTLVKRKNPHIDNLEPWGGPGLFSREVAGIAAHEALCWRHIRLLRELWKGKRSREFFHRRTRRSRATAARMGYYVEPWWSSTRSGGVAAAGIDERTGTGRRAYRDGR